MSCSTQAKSSACNYPSQADERFFCGWPNSADGPNSGQVFTNQMLVDLIDQIEPHNSAESAELYLNFDTKKSEVFQEFGHSHLISLSQTL